MATGSINLMAAVSGGPDGARTFGPLAITANTAVTAETSVTLVAGSVTVAVPAGATAVVLFPPNSINPVPNPAFGGSLSLRGVAGDTGIALSPKWPTVIPFDPVNPLTSFVLTSTAVGTLTAWFM